MALKPCYNTQRKTCRWAVHKANVTYCEILRDTDYPDWGCKFYKEKKRKEVADETD